MHGGHVRAYTYLRQPELLIDPDAEDVRHRRHDRLVQGGGREALERSRRSLAVEPALVGHPPRHRLEEEDVDDEGRHRQARLEERHVCEVEGIERVPHGCGRVVHDVRGAYGRGGQRDVHQLHGERDRRRRGPRGLGHGQAAATMRLLIQLQLQHGRRRRRAQRRPAQSRRGGGRLEWRRDECGSRRNKQRRSDEQWQHDE